VQNQFVAQPVHGGNLVWAASLAGCSPSAILDFSASINPLGPPLSAIASITAHLGALRDYPDPESRDLRCALGNFHALAPEWILPGNGSAELLTWVCRELAALRATYLPVPAFGDYRRALKAFDATIIPCLMDIDGGLAEQDVPLRLDQPLAFDLGGCGVLFNNPHNPTGRLFSRESLRPYLEQFGLVVVDEAFMDFLPSDTQQSVIDWVPTYPNLVVLRSLTKFYSLPGLRLGYAIAHPERLRRWQQWRDPWSVNTLAAAAAIAVLQDIDFQQQTLDWLPPARTQLFDGLAQIPGLLPYPGAANYLLVQTEQSAVELQLRLLKQRQILIRNCLSFPELGDRFFRVAVRTQAENRQLLDGLAATV